MLHFVPGRPSSKGVDEVEICVEEAGGVFKLRVVADVFVQHGYG